MTFLYDDVAIGGLDAAMPRCPWSSSIRQTTPSSAASRQGVWS
jgi:hypothetical protein